MTKAEADAIIAKIYDKMNQENSMAITDGKKEMGFSAYVDIDLIKKIVREATDDQA